MSSRRQVRELALQMLYQLDARGEADFEQITRTAEDAPFSRDVRQEAVALAEQAWANRAAADDVVSHIASDWPTHRQPIVDRNLIRMAHFEMASGRAPHPVAINEAIELAKLYGSERSPSFINGVLDRISRTLQQKTGDDATETPPPQKTGDAWLDDALGDKP